MSRNKDLKLFREYATASTIRRLGDERLAEQSGSVSAWSAPIWNIGKINLNGRVYTQELAERLIAENRATIAYDSHRHEWGEAYGNTVAVAKQPRIEDGLLWVDIFFVDKAYSDKLLAIHTAGVPIGVSSVGYGETDNDGVVNAATYELVRYLDFVTDPANDTYAGPGTEPEEGMKNESASSHDPDGMPPGSDGELSPKEIQRRIAILKQVEAID
ncbi:hypothetical protein [Sphaerochaeta sp. PS]|uniref:hypothetical protein n=1 Tax=Sphaerochaeta sp. PS TaxID=3076336 RepID=UPI0028A2E616|nr:hypothetical protein [Sphaerochaeta sp. PS]MDT4761826.1 hypothetical protein [Sphaerochaeta sp. PS]